MEGLIRIFSLPILGILALAVALLPASARAEQSKQPARFALLVANLGYNRDVGELHNPKHDIDRVESALLSIGFPKENVVAEVDVTAETLRKAVREHVARVKVAGEGAISFFYYSGHGAAAPKGTPGAKGENYIIPVDVDTTTRADFWERAIALDEVTTLLAEAPNAIHLVVFDACRNELKLPTRDIQAKGFEPMLQVAQMLLAFATAPNRIAYDSFQQSDNGPYSTALSEEIVKPNLDHLHVFANIRTRVMNMTGQLQVPWITDGLWRPTVLYSVLAHTSEHGANTTEKCDATPASLMTPEVPLLWTEIPNKSWIRFKTHGYTYQQARADARLVEEVEEGVAHHIATGTKISSGAAHDGKIAWYRYERDVGSHQIRYVIADEAELR